MKSNLKDELKKTLRHSAVYGLGSILSQLVGFLLIPIYTHFINPSEYGVLQLVLLTTNIIGIAVGLKITSGVFRFYFETDDVNERKIVISTAIIGIGVISGTILIPFVLGGNWLSGIILGNKNLGYLMKISFLALWFGLLLELVFAYIQIRERSGLFTTLSLARLITALSLNIYFVVVMKIGVLGIVLSTLINNVVYSAVGVPFLVRKIGVRFSWKWTKLMLRYGLPFFPATLGNIATHSSDRYFLRFYLSLADTGIYSLGYRMGSSIHNLFTVAFSRIWNVRKFALYKSDNALEIYAKMCTYFMGFLIFVALGMSLFAKDIVMIITPSDYWGASKIIPAVILCYLIFSFEDFVTLGILIAKKTERITLINLTGAALNIGFNFLLIPPLGLYGAVVSTFLTFFYKICGLQALSRKLLPIPFEWDRLFPMLIIAIFLFFISKTLFEVNMLARFVLNTMVWFSFPLLVWVIGLVRDQEKQEFKKIIDDSVKPVVVERLQNIYRNK